MQARTHTFLCSSTWVPSVPLGVSWELGALGIMAFQPPGSCGWTLPPSEPQLEASHVVCTTAASNTELKISWVLVQFWRCLDFWTRLCSDYRAHAFGNLNCCRGSTSLKKERRPFLNGDGEESFNTTFSYPAGQILMLKCIDSDGFLEHGKNLIQSDSWLKFWPSPKCIKYFNAGKSWCL